MSTPTAQYLDQLRESLNHGKGHSQDELKQIAADLKQAKLNIRPKDKDEELPLFDECGAELGTTVPRWIAHALALRHRCAHILLVWRSPKMGDTLVLQIRSWNKDDSPGRLDISVGGHMTADDSDAEQAAFAEMLQETGLTIDDLDGPLKPVGGYSYDEARPNETFFNSEWRDVYIGFVKQDRFGAIHFPDGEVSGTVLIPLRDADALLEQKTIPLASALRESLPKCLAHLRDG